MMNSASGGGYATDPDHSTPANEFSLPGRRDRDKGWPRDTGERTHLFLGLNYRMTDLVAAVAREQLRKVDEVVADRRRVAENLNLALDRPGVTVPQQPDHSFWLYPLVLDPAVLGGDNRALASLLEGSGLAVSPGYLQRVLYENPLFTERRTFGRSGWPLVLGDAAPPSCPVAERMVSATLVTIGINENFTDDDVEAAVAALTGALDELAEGDDE